jgi:O-antigen/teichoic acid export membrane protein
VLRLLGNLAATRLLLPEYFGLMALGNTVVLGLQLFTDVGTAVSVARDKREDREYLDTIFTLQVLRGMALCALSVVLGPVLAVVYDEPRLAWLVPALGVGPLLAGFNSTEILTHQQRLENAPVVRRELAAQLLGVLVMLGWAWWQRDVWALVAGAVAPHGLRALFSQWLGVRNRLHWDWEVARMVLAFAGWIAVGSGLQFLAGQLDRLLLGKLLTLGMLGVYGIALALAEMPRNLLMALAGGVLVPVASRWSGLGRGEFRARMVAGRRPLLAGVGVVILALVGLGGLLVRWLFDARYAEAQWMLPWLAAGLWPAALVLTAEPTLQVLGITRYGAMGFAWKLAFTAVGIPLGFTWFGVAGAVAVVAMNDVPYYGAVQVGLWRNGLAMWREDALFTGAFGLGLVGVWWLG